MFRIGFLSIAVSLALSGLALAFAPPAQAAFSKAENDGPPLSCKAGSFYSPRNGGECWSCPATMKRTALPVTHGKACVRPAYSTWHRRQIAKLGQKCRRGEFWSVKGGKGALGACYTCPAGYEKSVFGVSSAKACQRKHNRRHAKARYVSWHGCPKGAVRRGGRYSRPNAPADISASVDWTWRLGKNKR